MPEILSQTLLIYGLAIVVSLAIAAVIKVLVVGLNAFQRRIVAPVPAAAPAPAPAAGSPVGAGIDPAHVAAIAAAAYAVVGKGRIVHIEPAHRGSEWTAGGRLAHHTSHARPKPSR